MTVLRTASLALLSAFLMACGPRLPEMDDAGDETTEDAPPTDDLPCAGADFLTDDANCGACGNACGLGYEGTEWEAGNCIDGLCGPNWSTLVGSSVNCEAACGLFDRGCAPGGCGGVSGLMFALPWFDSGSTDLFDLDHYPIQTCDEPLNFVSDDETHSMVMCCCAWP